MDQLRLWGRDVSTNSGPPNDNTKRADNPVVEERGKNPAVFQGKGRFRSRIKQKSSRWNIRGKPKPIQNKYM